VQVALFELFVGLAALNVEIERSAWGVFETEFYLTYDFVPVRESIRERVRNGGK